MHAWIRSSRCGKGANCVEVATVPGGVRVRNSTRPEVEIPYTREEWDAFTAGVHAGEFDLLT